MVYLARTGHGADRESLLRETARLFGVHRVASIGRARLEDVLTAALAEGRLSAKDGLLSAPNDHATF